jgi:hypothetical protein
VYKSDPLIAYFDGWIFGVQMIDYLESTNAKGYLGPYQFPMLELFEEYLSEWPEMYIQLTGESPTELQNNIVHFGVSNPITDHYLNRTSITDETAAWVGEASIGFKSGVATLTDALRNISDRLNYHAEFTPKLVEWNVQKSVARIIGTDSLGIFIESLASLDRLAEAVDSIDQLVYSISDSVLTDIDRQRWETLGFISSERKAVLDQLSSERQILLEQLTQERIEVLLLIREEREQTMDHLEEIIENTTVYSFDRLDSIINGIFIKAVILAVIVAIGLVLAVVAYKKI